MGTVLTWNIRDYKIVFTCLPRMSALAWPRKHKSDLWSWVLNGRSQIYSYWESSAFTETVPSVLASSTPHSLFLVSLKDISLVPFVPCVMKPQGIQQKFDYEPSISIWYFRKVGPFPWKYKWCSYCLKCTAWNANTFWMFPDILTISYLDLWSDSYGYRKYKYGRLSLNRNLK